MSIQLLRLGEIARYRLALVYRHGRWRVLRAPSTLPRPIPQPFNYKVKYFLAQSICRDLTRQPYAASTRRNPFHIAVAAPDNSTRT